VNQLKLCAHELVSWSRNATPWLFLVAHVTKDGRSRDEGLEHLVDTVLSFERNDDEVRFLRALKNRFGSVDEIGIFHMGQRGLSPVEDPSGLFLIKRAGALPPGVAVVPVFEGSRVFMVEIQALVVPAKGAMTRVFSDRVDPARVSRVAAVIEKRVGLRLSDQDIYVNVAGGMRLTESAIDLALAWPESPHGLAVALVTAVIGELSLAARCGR
jgi:DNA repair protein RadA/Sms